MSERILTELIDYLVDTYGEKGAERLSGVKMIRGLAMQPNPPANWKSLVDKVALFNGIRKL